jgi:DNA polymerase
VFGFIRRIFFSSRRRVILRPSPSVIGERVMGTKDGHGAEAYLPPPDDRSLKRLREAAHECKGCELYAPATQVVFGEGLVRSDLMLVGEQPGDSEDREGRPFVGPAGRFLDKALENAGIDRKRVYLTNVVKHFRFERRGKRRLHIKPSVEHVTACAPWLRAEIDRIEPRLVVTLGATAGQMLLGRGFRVTRQRGEVLEAPEWGAPVMGTIHPSAILRMPDSEARRIGREAFVADLRVAREALTA